MLAGSSAPLTGARFGPGGGRIATASEDGAVRIWRADASAPPLVLAGHAGPLRSVEFSPDGRRLVTGADDATARVWDLERPGSSGCRKGIPARSGARSSARTAAGW